MIVDSIVSSYHKKHVKEFGLAKNIEAYIQSKVLKKTLEIISFDCRRNAREDWVDEAPVPAGETANLQA